MTGETFKKFDLSGRIAVITGGAGLLGGQHARAIADAGGRPILWDINGRAARDAAAQISLAAGPCAAMEVDITAPEQIAGALNEILSVHGRVHILINNAANDPKVGPEVDPSWSRLEHFPLAQWQFDLSVGLTGAFLCSQIIGRHMAEKGGGVILNIASDLSLIAPDQRLYRQENLEAARQPVKPVTYSVVKHGLVGLTKYLATYWADRKVRVNAISPGGVYTGQPEAFVERLTGLIPLGRMAAKDEYRAAVVFLCSDASNYMTGTNMVMDGGRSCW